MLVKDTEILLSPWKPRKQLLRLWEISPNQERVLESFKATGKKKALCNYNWESWDCKFQMLDVWNAVISSILEKDTKSFLWKCWECFQQVTNRLSIQEADILCLLQGSKSSSASESASAQWIRSDPKTTILMSMSWWLKPRQRTPENHGRSTF